MNPAIKSAFEFYFLSLSFCVYKIAKPNSATSRDVVLGLGP